MSNIQAKKKGNPGAPVATRWRQTIADQVRTLAEEVELRQEIDNPYVIGVPLTEQQEIFVGRTDISSRIEQSLLDRRRPPLLLYGQRRMGKTSLLNNLRRLLPSTIVPLFVELQGPASSSDHARFLYNLYGRYTKMPNEWYGVDAVPPPMVCSIMRKIGGGTASTPYSRLHILVCQTYSSPYGGFGQSATESQTAPATS